VLVLAAACQAVIGQDEKEVIIPSAFPVSRYQEEWNNSAFHREVVAKAVEKKIGPSFASSLRLEGLVMDSQGPIAYVRNTTDNKPMVITKSKADNAAYWIVDANLQANPSETSITISNGTETAEVKYEAAMLTAPIKTSRPTTKPTGKAVNRVTASKAPRSRPNITKPRAVPAKEGGNSAASKPKNGIPSGPAPSGNATQNPKPKAPAAGRKTVLPK